jgi:hypothetical protein
MKKDKKNEVPETPEKQSSNVSSYFTKEINEQISEMSMKEMEVLMKEMISSRVWIAFLKYINSRTPILDGILRATNPVKDPSSISWAQGCLAGLSDIEKYVIDLNNPEPEEEKEKEGAEFRPEGIID